ncbi:transposase family protein [Streptomyces sp. NPDC002285]
MAGGNNVSESTVRRWRDELIGLLAAQAPRLARTLKKIAKQGGEVVRIDGTLIPTQRRTGKADRRNYAGKRRRHGLHFLALTDERGRLIWISAARPGRTHDNTAARHGHILTHLRAPRPWDRHRLCGQPNPQANPGAEGSQPGPRRRTCTGRARLRPPQELSDAHQAPRRPRPRHPTPAGPAHPDEHRNQPLPDDLHRGLPPETSTSTPSTGHASPLTTNFKLAEA